MVLAPLPPSAVVLAQSSPVCIQVSNLSGQGNHVLQDGRRGVLREEIATYLEGLGLPAAPATGNDRMLPKTSTAGSPPPNTLPWPPLEL